MKSSHKLDYSRLAETLAERKLVERAALDHILQQCTATGTLMTELLVRESLISDWELSRVVCELYGLPFLPVRVYPPADHLLEGLDADYLRQYALVPLDRFGDVLTVAMPAMVPTHVLDGLVDAGEKVVILPAVGTVVDNRRWLDEHLPPSDMPDLETIGASLPAGTVDVESLAEIDLSGVEPSEGLADWAGIFDAGDEAVQDELRKLGDE